MSHLDIPQWTETRSAEGSSCSALKEPDTLLMLESNFPKQFFCL